MRILLIEDDPKLGPTLAKLLRKQGYQTDLLKNGLKGMNFAIGIPGTEEDRKRLLTDQPEHTAAHNSATHLSG